MTFSSTSTIIFALFGWAIWHFLQDVSGPLVPDPRADLIVLFKLHLTFIKGASVSHERIPKCAALVAAQAVSYFLWTLQFYLSFYHFFSQAFFFFFKFPPLIAVAFVPFSSPRWSSASCFLELKHVSLWPKMSRNQVLVEFQCVLANFCFSPVCKINK